MSFYQLLIGSIVFNVFGIEKTDKFTLKLLILIKMSSPILTYIFRHLVGFVN